MQELSKSDVIGCTLHRLAEAIEQIDTKFALEDGSIKIQGIEDIVELASLGYMTLKEVYTQCLGKEFEIKVDGVAGKILELLLALLLERQTNAKTQTISSTPTVYSSVSVS